MGEVYKIDDVQFKHLYNILERLLFMLHYYIIFLIKVVYNTHKCLENCIIYSRVSPNWDRFY